MRMRGRPFVRERGQGMEPVKIHIPNELFEPAEMQEFEGTADLGTVQMNGTEYAFAQPCAWQVQVTNTGGALLVRGTAQAEGACACARCLEDAQVSLEGEIEGYFVISPEGEDEDMEADEFDVLPENHDMDIAPLIVQGLMLDAPVQPLCQEECAGLCPKCGANLNEGACGCEPDEVDEGNPFAVLKGLSFE